MGVTARGSGAASAPATRIAAPPAPLAQESCRAVAAALAIRIAAAPAPLAPGTGAAAQQGNPETCGAARLGKDTPVVGAAAQQGNPGTCGAARLGKDSPVAPGSGRAGGRRPVPRIRLR
jgi:hypothetical protein